MIKITRFILVGILFFNMGDATPPTSVKPPALLFTKIGNVMRGTKNVYNKLSPRFRRTCAVIGLLAIPLVKPFLKKGYDFLIDYHFSQQADKYVRIAEIQPLKKKSTNFSDLKRTIPPVLLKIKSRCTKKSWVPFIADYFTFDSQKKPIKLLIHSQRSQDLTDLMHALVGEKVNVFCANDLIVHEGPKINEDLRKIYKTATLYSQPVVWFCHIPKERSEEDLLSYLLPFLERSTTYGSVVTIVTTHDHLAIDRNLRDQFTSVEEYKEPSMEQNENILDHTFKKCGLTRSTSCTEILKKERLSKGEIDSFLSLCELEIEQKNLSSEVNSGVANEVLPLINRQQNKINRQSMFPRKRTAGDNDNN